jgi:hypothetical protein
MRCARMVGVLLLQTTLFALGCLLRVFSDTVLGSGDTVVNLPRVDCAGSILKGVFQELQQPCAKG